MQVQGADPPSREGTRPLFSDAVDGLPRVEYEDAWRRGRGLSLVGIPLTDLE